MTRTLITLTALQLLGRRRAILIALGALLPIGVALLYRFVADDSDRTPPIEFAPEIVDGLIITLLMPLGALIFGTASLGAEIEDGTAVYLLAKPIARWRIMAVKVGVAAAATVALTALAALLTAFIILGGEDPHSIAIGFTVGASVAGIVYSSVFVALSAFTGRALVIGLGYVFVWEAFITGIFTGTRWFSIHQYALGIADLISTAPRSAFEADLDGVGAALTSAAVIAGSFLLGVRFLKRFEIGERQ